MTAGDIDDHLGPIGELQRLANETPRLKDYLAGIDDLPIYRGSIPFSAGISVDGRIRYLDNALDTSLNGVDVSLALATHESVEWALREFCQIGVDYANDPRGHRLANREEYEKVTDLWSKSGKPNIWEEAPENGLWEQYDDFIDPQVRRIEKSPVSDVPPDLALYPYVGTPWLSKIKAAMVKLPKDMVNYRLDFTTGRRQCSNCSMFLRQSSSCTLVAGEILAQYVCDRWRSR